MENGKKQGFTPMKRKPLPQCRTKKTNFRMSESGFQSFERIRNRLKPSTNNEAFNLIYTFFSPYTKKPENIRFPVSNSNNLILRKTFTVNEYLLAELKRLAEAFGLSVDALVDSGAITIADTLDYLKGRGRYAGYDTPEDALAEIDKIWGEASLLRAKLDRTFPDLEKGYDHPESLDYHFANIEGGFNDLYFLIGRLAKRKGAE